MPKLIGLPGVAGGEIDDMSYFSSITDGLKKLTSFRAVTAAGDNGAVTVYKDDEGHYRCMFARHMTNHDETTTPTKSGVRDWLKSWHPKMH